ncbi:2Fe-2S iron-sulfur cluster-binding protein [Pseudonocardia alni]|uniref:2Fe-2S iron-sulfur cluster-binding protein n=1 Tax=Pseudonocardia alni TaxID=33907 RepID=UPI003323C3E7
MPIVTYVQPDGAAIAIDVAEGSTVKDGAVDNDIDGILAECGGNLACATCHVYVDSDPAAALPAMTQFEDAMLDDTAAPRKNLSRLSCQLTVTLALDGIVVTIPDEQI